jgi:cation diffusion facilitator family transporter
MRKNILRRVVLISLIGNILLTIIKLISGYYGKSESLFSDGINSFVDIFISLMLFIVLKVSSKKADDNHPYGHEKYEGILYLFLSMFIMVVAIILGFNSISNLIFSINNPTLIVQPLFMTIIVVIIALIMKVGLYTLNFKTAKKYNSVAIYADSKNHLFDILSTTISLISIILTRLGALHFESIASILIAIFIFYSGFKMVLDAISYLVDEAPDIEVIASIKDSILTCQGVIKIDDLKVRKHMSQLYVDVEISVDSNLSLQSAHNISEDVHDHIEELYDVIHCMVHVNPYKKK